MNLQFKKVFLCLSTLALSWAYCSSALAYPTPVDFEGALLRWDISPEAPVVTWKIVASESTIESYKQVIEESADIWNGVPNSYLTLEEFNPNIHDFNTQHITINLASSIEGSAFSSGYSIFDEYDGKQPTHCSIHVLVGPGEYGIGKTTLHELGHCIGLGHSLIPESIMSYYLDTNLFALDLDDEAAVSRLYPSNGEDPQLPIGCSVGAHSQKKSSQLFLIFLLLLPFFLGISQKTGPYLTSRFKRIKG